VLADPEFPGLAMRLRIRPSPAPLRALGTLLASKGPFCDIATSKGNVETKVLELVGRGFLVKIPQKFFLPLRLPISVQEELPMLDRQLSLTATPDTLVITKQRRLGLEAGNLWGLVSTASRGDPSARSHSPYTAPVGASTWQPRSTDNHRS